MHGTTMKINIMNLKMYLCYKSYTHLNSSEYFESYLISVINPYPANVENMVS